MAFLDATTVTCDTCGLSGSIQIVVGVGPSSQKGDTPYKRFRKQGPFEIVEPNGSTSERQLACPHDGTIVWTNKAGKKA